MFAGGGVSHRARRAAGAVIQQAWRWVTDVGGVAPMDRAGRRFRAMGEGSWIAFPPGAVYGERWIEIGSRVLIGPQVSLAVGLPNEPRDHDAPPVIRIGHRCSVGRGSSIIGRRGIVIEDDVVTGPNVYVTDHNHAYGAIGVPIREQWLTEAAIHIGAGSWLGAGVIVLPGSHIGRQVVVAAGSVVRGDVPDYSVVAGAPARIVRRHVEGEGWVPPMRA